ncbi:MAG: hypothetical protein MOGMAGMI_00595 [Candidatus Omnitrophica bacterium]|nr:hypothetical protein [Candidatus Omnitrophota bacterium]
MIFARLGAVLLFVGVALGAFGAHALRGRLDAYQMDLWKTATLYQLVHALGLIAVAWLHSVSPDPKIRIAGWLMTAGILVFSGSLYALALTGIKVLGAVTPLGGLCLLAAWALIALARLRP